MLTCPSEVFAEAGLPGEKCRMKKWLNHVHIRCPRAVGSVIIATSGALGCQPAPVPQSSPVVMDSGEIRIVYNVSMRAVAEAWSLDPLPNYVVGGSRNGQSLELDSRVPHAVVQLDNGRVVVSDGARLLVLSDDGQLVRLVGREGSGPGDFRQIRTLCHTRGDTVALGDEGNRRIVLLDAGGQVVRTIPEDYGSPFTDACFSDGTFLVQAFRVDQREGKYPAVEVTRLRLDGTEAKHLGNLSFEGVDFLQYHGEIVSARGQRLVVSEAKASEVRSFGPEGDTRTIVRTADTPKAISRREVRALIQATIPTNVSPDEVRVRMARSESRPHRSTRPAFERCMLDDMGGTWLLQVRETAGAPESWVHFDSSGQMTGRLTLGAGRRRLRAMRFGRGNIWLQSRDDDGVVTIASYRLGRIGQPDPPGRRVAR